MSKLSTILLLSGLLLAGCGVSVSGNNSFDVSSAVVNGTRNPQAGVYELGVSVRTRQGDLVRSGTISNVSVSGLSAGSASASVCGSITDQGPVTAAVSLDATGSMSTNDPQQLRAQAANAFIDRMGAADRAAVLSFDTGTSSSSGLLASRLWQGMTGDKTALKTAVRQATFDGGATPLYDAVVDAVNVARSTGGSNRVALILTDGENNAGQNSWQSAIAQAQAAGVAVYLVGLDAQNQVDFSAMQRIASSTGGLFQKATTASQLQPFFDRVFDASQAQGCVRLNFYAVPQVGTRISGNLLFTVSNGASSGTVSAPFEITVMNTLPATPTPSPAPAPTPAPTPPPAPAPRSSNFAYNVKLECMPTGITVAAGERGQFTATGQMMYGAEPQASRAYVEPDGQRTMNGQPYPPKYDQQAVVPSLPIGYTFAKVNNHVYPVGKSAQLTFQESGALSFCLNESHGGPLAYGSYDDNEGSYYISITVN